MNPGNPRVSIIITTFNGSKYIGETIETVLRQDFTDWELIIVDDGSTDNTEEVVRSHADERVTFLKAGRIGKNGKVKNLGLEKCRGEFIAFIDHDDLWHAEKLSRQVRALESNHGAGFCLTGGYNFREKGVPCEYFYATRSGERVGSVFHDFFLSRLAVLTQALLVRRRCVQEVNGFDESLVFADPAFIAKLASRFTAVILHEPLLFRRLHEMNSSTHYWEECQQEGIAMIRHYSATKELPRSLARQALFRSYVHAGEKYLRQGRRTDAIRHFLLACNQRPMSLVAWKKLVKGFLGQWSGHLNRVN